MRLLGVDRARQAQRTLPHQAQSVSAETRVRILHSEWDETAVREEVDRILAETGQTAPEPI